ncbi:hypothetical protein ACFQZE_08270 [Paenibacillus sp. GCM10027627]
MKKLTLVLMATMMLLFSFSSTTSASGLIHEENLGYVFTSYRGMDFAVGGIATIPPSPYGTYQPVTVLVWQLYNGQWYNVLGDQAYVIANGQSQAFGLNDLRVDYRQQTLKSGIYKITIEFPAGSTWSNITVTPYHW